MTSTTDCLSPEATALRAFEQVRAERIELAYSNEGKSREELEEMLRQRAAKWRDDDIQLSIRLKEKVSIYLSISYQETLRVDLE